ncbi:MAG: hypothetical protein KAU52_01390, partial [Methanosarcinales archaeon]|nr:hypothetical protein [Methanosarcinales archaeon]
VRYESYSTKTATLCALRVFCGLIFFAITRGSPPKRNYKATTRELLLCDACGWAKILEREWAHR